MRNKKQFAILVLGLAIFIGPLSVLAVTAKSETSAANGIRSGLKTKTEEAQTLAARKQKIKALRRIAVNQVQRSEKAISRLDGVMDRIDVRLKVFEQTGVDISSVTPLVEKAKKQKAEAEILLADIEMQRDAITAESASLQQSVKQFMANVKTLKKKLIELHKTLKDVVKAMKKLDKPETSSSSEVDSSEEAD